jgi:hypothetical protein
MSGRECGAWQISILLLPFEHEKDSLQRPHFHNIRTLSKDFSVIDKQIIFAMVQKIIWPTNYYEGKTSIMEG